MLILSDGSDIIRNPPTNSGWSFCRYHNSTSSNGYLHPINGTPIDTNIVSENENKKQVKSDSGKCKWLVLVTSSRGIGPRKKRIAFFVGDFTRDPVGDIAVLGRNGNNEIPPFGGMTQKKNAVPWHRALTTYTNTNHYL